MTNNIKNQMNDTIKRRKHEVRERVTGSYNILCG